MVSLDFVKYFCMGYISMSALLLHCLMGHLFNFTLIDEIKTLIAPKQDTTKNLFRLWNYLQGIEQREIILFVKPIHTLAYLFV